MFILDDILVKPFTSILDILHTMALNELYDTAETRDELKENQLLYEVGERSQAEYEERKQELELRLEMAEQIKSQMGDRIEVKS
ncbi:gas vesicle protein GvpG [Halorubrum sp. RMP-47]|uniref:Gas vesicle protein GvpG n=1 Tax=Halorubrum miltondacostae TaxID=3076378 RepID=A0ABD5M7Y1_9EURY